jgi:hypothetical protein
MASTLTGVVPMRFDINPCMTTSTPSDATALAKGGALRKGRKTATYNNAPSNAEMINVRINAPGIPNSCPMSTVVGSPGMIRKSFPCRKNAYV